MPPTQIGKYDVVRLLGQGAMGEVYLAEDPVLGRAVAIKVMKTAGEEDRQRFLHEARIVATLSHPRIVVLHDFAVHEGHPYIVMEHLVGQDLEAWLKTPRSLPDELRIIEGLLAALAYAHGKGVVHRDVKPANVHVTPDGECKLMDFGIARSEEARMTATGVIMGTPSYMAPEVLESAHYSAAADVFAVGVVLYEMFSGRNPFLGKGLAATVTNVLTVHPPPLGEVRPDLPPALTDGVMACLEKDPARRAADLSGLHAVVSRLRAGGPETAAAPRPATPPRGVEATQAVLRVSGNDRPTQLMAEPGPERPDTGRAAFPGRRPRALAAAGIVVALAAAFGVWEVARRPPAGAPETAPSTSIGSSLAPATTAPGPTPLAVRPASPSATSPVRTPRERQVAAASAVPPPTTPPAPTVTSTPPPASPAAAVPLPPATLPSAAPVTAAPVTAAPAASLADLAPRSARRGSSLTIELRGAGLRADHRARFLRGRVEANGIRVVRQALSGPTLLRLTVLFDEDVALGSYVVALVDAEGRATNGLAFEVIL